MSTLKMIKTLDDVPSISAYLRRVGAEARSLRTAVVLEKSGSYWRDICTIHFDNANGEVSVQNGFDAYKPTDAEAQRIKDDIALHQWPTVKLIKRLTKLPEALSKADPDAIYEFRDADDNILMLQQRVEIKDEKKYIPWTFYNDDEWRRMEPEGKLPLWGLDQLNDNTTVFIHEGAKAARAVRRMVEAKTADQKEKLKAHPWGEELSGAAHLGWIGGALSPYRTDWSALKRHGVKRAYIVSDNDTSGISAVAPISQQLRLPTYHVQFTQDWPQSFDLADDFPEKMFPKLDGKRYYNGPSFRSCVMPATWATDLLPPAGGGKGKPTAILREHFKEMWAYVEEVDLFVCIEMPDIIRAEPILNKMLAGFSHVSNTCSLMVRSYRGRSTRLAYRPDLKGRVISDRTTSAINLHTPTHIKVATGKVEPFLEFLKYLFPVEIERKEVTKWLATLIARPDIRMLYALLLISEKQGMGKTVLGEKILAPLVGEQNVSFPNEKDIVESQFNGWLAHKRLVIVAEIYSGHSWKAYNQLKHFITDKFVDVNEKFERPYRIENWAHFFVSSNSRRALKMEDDDRRWYYPTVTEVPWPAAKFTEFLSWLQSGGLSIIKGWAENYNDYIEPGARAPMTGLKKELIESSRSEAQREVADLAQAACDWDEPIAFSMKEIEGWVRAAVEGRVFDSDQELRKVMTEVGLVVAKHRIKVSGRLQYVIMSPKAYELVRSVEDLAEYNTKLRQLIKPPNTVIGQGM